MTHTTTHKPLRCFRPIERTRPQLPDWVSPWCNELHDRPIALAENEQEAFARLLPLLVCGEQSAISVFHHEAQRDATAMRTLRASFQGIEHDESGHEVAWQTLFAALPEPADRHRIQRRATRFFARLGRADTVADHFAQIAQLDSSVGAIMWHLERSRVAADSRVRWLAQRIKTDEARHVGISRRHSRSLGVARDRFESLGERIRADLVDLLAPESGALEMIGIDADQLFRRISGAARPTL